MSAPSDGARGDARKRLAEAYHIATGQDLPTDDTEALADLVFFGDMSSSSTKASCRTIASHILASDWLAGVIADAKAEALREAADLYRSLGDSLPICAGHVVAELDIRADDWARR